MYTCQILHEDILLLFSFVVPLHSENTMVESQVQGELEQSVSYLTLS